MQWEHLSQKPLQSSLRHRMWTFKNRFPHRLILLGLFISVSPVLPAATPSSIMSEAMITMMDAMGDLAHRFKGTGNWSLGDSYRPNRSRYGFSRYPYNLYSLPGNGLPYGLPLQSPAPNLGGPPAPGALPFNSPLHKPSVSPVDGIWLGRAGEIVLVMYGHFRIYASTEVYRDGRFEIIGERLVMYDPESDRRMLFDYHLREGHMILRSQSGIITQFKQLPIPIPPYYFFASPVSPNY
ncbi:MAG: hypothetical protein PVI92_12200 [Chromatiales bacterium]|jgi:hypothetical protein